MSVHFAIMLMEGTDGKERISIYIYLYIYILFTHVYMYMISLADFSISCWLLTPSARHGVRLDWFSFGWFVVEVQCLSRCSGDFCYSLLATYTHTHTTYTYIFCLHLSLPLTLWPAGIFKFRCLITFIICPS